MRIQLFMLHSCMFYHCCLAINIEVGQGDWEVAGSAVIDHELDNLYFG